MASTLTTELARINHDGLILVELEGAGRRRDHDVAGASTGCYRLTTCAVAGDSAGTLVTDRLIPCLTRLPETLSERLDLDAGTTDLGQLQVGLRCLAVPSATVADQGWTHLLGMFATRASDYRWKLRTACSAAGGTIDYDDAPSDPAVGDALWIGAEAVVVTNVDAVGHQLDVTRGCLGTTAQAHRLWPEGDGYLDARPRHWKGRRVTIKLLLRDWSVEPDPATGLWYTVPDAEARTLWSGVLEDATIQTPGELLLSCRSSLSRLNRAVGRRLWEGEARGFQVLSTFGTDLGEVAESGAQINLRVDLPPEARARLPERSWTLDGLGSQYCDLHCRIGEQVSEVRVWQTAGATEYDPMHRVEVLAWRCCGTDDPDLCTVTDYAGADGARVIREVLPTSSQPRGSYLSTEDPLLSIQVDGEPSEHPLDILLALATSTGSGIGTNGPWDYSPAPWGLAIPYTDFDLSSIREIKTEPEGLRMPGFVLGWDGRPTRLLSWWQENIGKPLGWFLHLNAAGQYRVSRLRDAYPRSPLWTIEPEYIVPGSLRTTAGWAQTAGLQTIRTGRTVAGEYLSTRRVWPAEAVERLQDDDSEITIDAPGIPYGDAAGDAALAQRSQQLARWWTSPLPAITLAVKLRYLASVQLGDLVEFGAAIWPDLAEGVGNLAGLLGVVVEYSLDVGAACVRLTVRQVPEQNVGYWCPSARVTNWVAGTHTLTVEANAFSSGDEEGAAEATDATHFVATDAVAIYDPSGAPLCDAPQYVVSCVGNTVVVDGDFTLGGVDQPVPAGTILTYCRYGVGAAAPDDTWTATMQDCVAQADESLDPPTIAVSGDDAYIYGG